ncbi:MAG: hypothetical protein OEL87_01635 [Nanoarchaeota archaeon]|nr:hypothetical protein [Nanoarchaeota archaeon]
MNDNKSPIEYSSVRFTQNEIIEFDEKNKSQQLLNIKRENINKISLIYGVASERPIVDIIIGTIFLLAGIYIGLPLLENLITTLPQSAPGESSFYPSKFVSWSLLFFPCSAIFYYLAFRRRYYFKVETKQGPRKIVFNSKIPSVLIQKFIKDVKATFGWEIKQN